jgi:hypothetical protein
MNHKPRVEPESWNDNQDFGQNHFSGMTHGATLSDDRAYRYLLWRSWSGPALAINFIMLNPSTADEVTNDPTVIRCIQRAKTLGSGKLYVTNLFAGRATNPKDLFGMGDPVGPSNNEFLVATAAKADLVVAAWGNHGQKRDRASTVLKFLSEAGIKLHIINYEGRDIPAHPLYLPYSLKPRIWNHKPR